VAGAQKIVISRSVAIGRTAGIGGRAMVMEKLQRQDLCALLNPKEVERLSRASGVVGPKKGEKLYSEGLPTSHLFVLLKGKVELRRPADDSAELNRAEAGNELHRDILSSRHKPAAVKHSFRPVRLTAPLKRGTI
jgi:signal-transduction protein with cAMP-binding, CBS, and nucleotidyltransferase domain